VSETIQAVLDRALEAYAELAELGESIEDEWSYVNDLAEAWRDRIGEVATDRGAESVPASTSVAVDRSIAEIRLIADPHRAIDWLSTFPQVVLLAVGATP
jgi:hypothetical protein